MSHPLVGAWIETALLVLRCPRTCVAPLVGAWIETSMPPVLAECFQSHPSWVRGLKLVSDIYGKTTSEVAPLVGAWIETRNTATLNLSLLVAPLVGAWIETLEKVED